VPPAARTGVGCGSARRPIEGTQPPHLIVLLSLVGVGEHAVRLRNLLEALAGLCVVRIGIGMVLLGEPAIRLLDLVLARRVRNAEDVVEVLRGHGYAWSWAE